jgi:hypothetical protein
VKDAPNDTLVAVHVANALSCSAGGTLAEVTASGLLDVAYVERSRVGSELPRWCAIAEKELGQARAEAAAGTRPEPNPKRFAP